MTAHELHEALDALGCPAILLVRDPVRAMRYVASAERADIGRALKAVLVDAPDVEQMEEETLRLFASAVLATAFSTARRQLRDRGINVVKPVPTP